MYAPKITRSFNRQVERITNGEESGDQYSADAWRESIEEVYKEFGVECPLHVVEDGFEQGDASDEEIQALMVRMDVETEEEVYLALTASLEHKYTSRLDAIEEELQEKYSEDEKV